MDLKSFVELSLSQIVEGIMAAQARPEGRHIAAEMYGIGGNLISGGTSGIFTPVEFDVSIVATSKDGSGSLQVSSVQISDGSERSSQNTSRVKFSVHLRLPQGGMAY